MTSARLYFVHALSPLHAGTGQGVGAIDLPIAREKATNIPYLPGSSLKGVLRDRCRQDAAHKDNTVAIFGPETQKADEHAGTLVLADARLLLLPVRSIAGTFAWVTSPFLLLRFGRDSAGAVDEKLPAMPGMPALTDNSTECWVAKGSKLKSGNTVMLEDLDLGASEKEEATRWAEWLGQRLWPGDTTWQTIFSERLCIVADDLMNFLAATATETIARIRMEPDRKTVVDGQLWYEEALPAESILAGLAVATPVKAVTLPEPEVLKTLEALTKDAVQLGGKATVGRGLCRVVVGPQAASKG